MELAVVLTTLGLVTATVATFREVLRAGRGSWRRKGTGHHLEIKTRSGELIGSISLDAIDKEDPSRLDDSLRKVRKTKEQAPAC